MELAIHPNRLGKINNIARVTGFFTDLGIPFPALSAHFISGLEFVGRILLVLGRTSRPIAVPLTISMLVAYITADREALFAVISEPDRFYTAAPYTFLFAALIVLIFGPGQLAADAWIARNRQSGVSPSTDTKIPGVAGGRRKRVIQPQSPNGEPRPTRARRRGGLRWS